MKANQEETAAFNLDGLYPVGEIAPWMRLTTRGVLKLVREGRIPVVRLNRRVLRFHPRTILAKVGNGGSQ